MKLFVQMIQKTINNFLKNFNQYVLESSERRYHWLVRDKSSLQTLFGSKKGGVQMHGFRPYSCPDYYWLPIPDMLNKGKWLCVFMLPA